jgi:hypothetical protein
LKRSRFRTFCKVGKTGRVKNDATQGVPRAGGAKFKQTKWRAAMERLLADAALLQVGTAGSGHATRQAQRPRYFSHLSEIA